MVFGMDGSIKACYRDALTCFKLLTQTIQGTFHLIVRFSDRMKKPAGVLSLLKGKGQCEKFTSEDVVMFF